MTGYGMIEWNAAREALRSAKVSVRAVRATELNLTILKHIHFAERVLDELDRGPVEGASRTPGRQQQERRHKVRWHLSRARAAQAELACLLSREAV